MRCASTCLTVHVPRSGARCRVGGGLACVATHAGRRLRGAGLRGDRYRRHGKSRAGASQRHDLLLHNILHGECQPRWARRRVAVAMGASTGRSPDCVRERVCACPCPHPSCAGLYVCHRGRSVNCRRGTVGQRHAREHTARCTGASFRPAGARVALASPFDFQEPSPVHTAQPCQLPQHVTVTITGCQRGVNASHWLFGC